MPQGGPLQDLYLTGTNLLSSTIVFIDGNNVSSVVPSANVSEVVVANTNGIRVRLTSAFLATAGTHTVQIQKQGGTPLSCTGTAPCSFQTVPVRPSLVSSSPASTLQQGQFSSTIRIDGGYFGAPSSPIVTASFEGSIHSVLPTSPRQITVLLDASELKTPGLHPLAVQNNNATPSMAVTNVAVQPDPNVNAPSLLGSPIPMPPGATGEAPTPSAITVDSTLGIGIVTLKGTDSLQLLNLNTNPPSLGAAIQLPNGNAAVAASKGQGTPLGPCILCPTGVAVDNQLHMAAVANNTGRSVSIVDLQAGSVPGTIDLSAVTPGTSGAAPILPFSVGVDPDSHLGLVAYQSANTGSIINVGQTLPAGASCILGGTPPYCVIGQVTLSTGDSPQIAFEPHLRWAMVTPGGAGLMSYVTLNPQATAIPILSVARSVDVVTVTTATNHGLNPSLSSPQTVLITGVTGDTSFDGTFTVASVPTATTFTFSQTGADKTVSNSDGTKIGSLYFSDPLVTLSINSTVQGIAISPETFTAVLTDRNASQSYVVSTISQTVRSVTLTEGSNGEQVLGGVAAAFQPYTNVAVVVSNLKNEIFLIDPVSPRMLGGSTVSLGTNPISTGGTGSSAVAIDPPTNLALVANSTSNDVSTILLNGNNPPIKPLHISDVIIPDPARVLTAGFTFTSASNLNVTILGSGFSGSTEVLLDGAVVGSGTVSNNGRQIDITIPASFLAAPRRYALQVSGGGVVSNAENFSVVQSIDFSGVSCGTSNPSQLAAVGIDADRDLAVVTNAGCNNVSLIDVSPTDGKFGQIIQTVGVGTAPEGVAVISRLGLAVVTNRNIDVTTLLSLGTGTVSLVNLDTFALATSDITVGTEPLAVDVDQDAGTALVANFGSNSVSVIDLVATLAGAAASPPTTPIPITFSVNQQPTALAIDPDLHLAAVLNSTSGTIDLMNTVEGGITNSILTIAKLFTGVAFDPVAGNGEFYATAADIDAIYIVDPSTGTPTPIPGGINPGPIAFNYETGGIVAVNPGSNTMSIFDAQNITPQAVFGPVTGTAQTAATSVAQQFGVAIHPRTNLAVVVDQPNNRVLLMPLPK
jgi:DNA-binding beta-propeller fold protein YncE